MTRRSARGETTERLRGWGGQTGQRKSSGDDLMVISGRLNWTEAGQVTQGSEDTAGLECRCGQGGSGAPVRSMQVDADRMRASKTVAMMTQVIWGEALGVKSLISCFFWRHLIFHLISLLRDCSSHRCNQFVLIPGKEQYYNGLVVCDDSGRQTGLLGGCSGK